MTKELAEFLQRATEHCGDQEISIHDDYSGRGMFGQKTHAIVVADQGELLLNTIQYILETIDARIDMGHEGAANATSFIPDVSDMRKLRTDSMGRDSIVIY